MGIPKHVLQSSESFGELIKSTNSKISGGVNFSFLVSHYLKVAWRGPTIRKNHRQKD